MSLLCYRSVPVTLTVKCPFLKRIYAPSGKQTTSVCWGIFVELSLIAENVVGMITPTQVSLIKSNLCTCRYSLDTVFAIKLSKVAH